MNLSLFQGSSALLSKGIVRFILRCFYAFAAGEDAFPLENVTDRLVKNFFGMEKFSYETFSFTTEFTVDSNISKLTVRFFFSHHFKHQVNDF